MNASNEVEEVIEVVSAEYKTEEREINEEGETISTTTATVVLSSKVGSKTVTTTTKGAWDELDAKEVLEVAISEHTQAEYGVKDGELESNDDLDCEDDTCAYTVEIEVE